MGTKMGPSYTPTFYDGFIEKKLTAPNLNFTAALPIALAPNLVVDKILTISSRRLIVFIRHLGSFRLFFCIFRY